MSVPFTWLLPDAFQLAVSYRQQGYRVRAGGPAVRLLPGYLVDVCDIGVAMENILERHNPFATFTSRGCPRQCQFCAVPLVEGDLVELQDWEPRPLVCDNNLLAASRGHFNRVVDRLRGIAGVDFNQGLDVRLLKRYHLDRLQELDIKVLRFAWDHVGQEKVLFNALDMVKSVGFGMSRVSVYVLVGFDDGPSDALYRCEQLRARGVKPFVQRYQPLDTLVKNSYVGPGWMDRQLRDFVKYWNRQRWYAGIPFEDFGLVRKKRVPPEQLMLEGDANRV